MRGQQQRDVIIAFAIGNRERDGDYLVERRVVAAGTQVIANVEIHSIDTGFERIFLDERFVCAPVRVGYRDMPPQLDLDTPRRPALRDIENVGGNMRQEI